jgi:ABC-type antimicrobial peptide transport system permease subunit
MKLGFKRERRAIPNSMLFFLAYRNLLSKRLRTGLTLAGVVIGIGAIYFLLSFGIGLQKIVNDEIVGNQSIKSVDVASPNSQLLSLNIESLNKFSQLAHVESAGGSFQLPGILQANGAEIDAVSYAVDQAYLSISNLSATYGRLLNAEDNRHVVLNTSALESLGISNPEDAIGKEVFLTVPIKSGELNTKIEDDFEIVGIIGTGSGSEVFLPSHLVSNAGLTSFTQVKLVVDENENVEGVRTQIESQGFETQSPIDTITEINQVFKYFNFILVGFGAIGMIVAILGMFNTLTISLLERTKEIGLMIALGARSRDMNRLFVLEATILSLVGAIVGILLSIVFGFVINLVMNFYAKGRGVTDSFSVFSNPWWLIVGMIVFMVFVGLIVVFFPARRAEHISPIEALRRE